MALAEQYQTVWVPEYARNFIGRLNRAYVQQDLLKIAQMQVFTEDELALQANSVLLCDTNLLVIKVWSEFKYGNCDPEILHLMNARQYDLHILTYIDVPWENDPQREHPDKRNYFYSVYKNELEQAAVNFIEIQGNAHERLVTAQQSIDALF